MQNPPEKEQGEKEAKEQGAFFHCKHGTVFIVKKEQGGRKGTGGCQTRPGKEQGDKQPKEQGPFSITDT